MTAKILTKTLAAALTAAVISASFASNAYASDRGFEVKPVKQHSRNHGRGNKAALGLALGIGGALLGAAIVNAQPRQHAEPRYHGRPRYDGEGFRGQGFRGEGYRGQGYRGQGFRGEGFQNAGAYQGDEEDCFRKPVRRFDHYSGRMVIVGSKVVCR